jgi:hypothetical protein
MKLEVSGGSNPESTYKNYRAHASNTQASISETTTWTFNALEQFLVVRLELVARKGSWSSMLLHCTTVHAVANFIRTTRLSSRSSQYVLRLRDTSKIPSQGTSP